MNASARIVASIAIFAGILYFVSSSLNNLGGKLADKTVKDAIAGQVRYHQGTLKVTVECSAFKTKFESVNTSATMDEATRLLTSSSADARKAGCLK